MLCFWEKFSLWNASTQPINLVVEEISRNKCVVQTPITYFINQKEKHMSIWHNSILTWIKSDAPFFRIDIIYMIYFDVKYFSVVCLSIRCLKLAVKTTVTRVGHFLAKKLNVCPSNIIFVCPTKTDLDCPHWEDEPEVQVNQKVQNNSLTNSFLKPVYDI